MDALGTQYRGAAKLGLFALLTICGFVVFALTMTFVPVMPRWAHYASRFGLVVILGTLWWVAPKRPRLKAFRPVFFAFLAAVLGQSLGFFLGDWGLRLFGLTTTTPAGVAVAKLWQASLTVIGILVTARLCGEDLASLHVRKGRLALGLSVGLIAAAACTFLALQQPAMRAAGTARLLSLTPWILLFVSTNALMEELLFRGLFLGRYSPLIGTWPAILSTALAFTLAHMQVTYAAETASFLVVLLGLSVAWGWLMARTGSLWGSAIFHAGADMLIMVPVFNSFHAM